MTPDLDRLLCMRYPQIFPSGDLPPRSGVGNGWFHLLDTLCGELQAAAESGGPQVVPVQIGQQFGRLEFNTRLHRTELNDEQRGMIAHACAMSTRTCEVCGAPGALVAVRRSGARTRCIAHADRGIDQPVPALYVHVDTDTGHAIGQIVTEGKPGTIITSAHFHKLMAAARGDECEECQTIQLANRDELQVVRVRDLAELPTRLAE